MFVRITWGQSDPGVWNRFEEKYREVTRAETPGLSARWLVRDTNNTDSFFAISLWDDVDSIARWEASDDYKKVFLPAVEAFTIGSYSVSVCEVRFANFDRLISSRSQPA